MPLLLRISSFRPRFALADFHPHLWSLRTRTMGTRTYSEAVDHLNSLQSNAATLQALREGKSRMDRLAIPEMVEYLGRIGYSASILRSP